MRNIIIKRTPNADTRTIEVLDKKLVYKDTVNHVLAVNTVMTSFAGDITARGLEHDHTKLDQFKEFFADISSRKTGAEFKKLPWWQFHLTERHHLNDRCPDDVNLIDVIEMVVDCVCAGKARTGTVFPIEISNEILQKAVLNTVEMLKNKIEVVD